MHCPPLSELPSPPMRKTGWPWTADTPPLPDSVEGQPWPKVSVVTPSYNQFHFIEETIRSVLLQGYPTLEYIIIDGGSTDGSVDLIRKYEPWLFYWVSEPDKGQSDAINKGWSRATGEILAYLNSDDIYLPHAIGTAVKSFIQHPDVGMVHGDSYFIDDDEVVFREHRGRDLKFQEVLAWSSYISQPTVFLRKHVVSAVGMMDKSLHYAMDYDLWLRVGLDHRMKHLPCLMAKERHHTAAKTVTAPEKGIGGQIWALERFYSRELPLEVKCLKRKTLAMHYANMAYCLFSRKKITEARVFLIKAIALNPKTLLIRKTAALVLFATLLGTKTTVWLVKAKRRFIKKRRLIVM